MVKRYVPEYVVDELHGMANIVGLEGDSPVSLLV
jgi:hypothetical protein